MGALIHVDLLCSVVHSFEHVISETYPFMLNHVLELLPRLNNIYDEMI